MQVRASIRKRRRQLADGYSDFGAGEPREKHLRRKLEREWRSDRLSEESLGRWVWALDLHPVAAGLSGWRPRCTENEWEDMEREAAQVLAEQRARNAAVIRWYAVQLQRGREVSTAELADRLGAIDETQARALLNAFAFDLFHRRQHRHLWRALKRQEGLEAGLTGAESQAEARRVEAELERLTARPISPERPARLKRPRPIEHRPQIQPNAPTN